MRREEARETRDRQIVWLSSEAVEFSAPCERCRADLERGRDVWSIGLRTIAVEGRLRAEADVGFTTCRRGHRIVVRRAVSRPLAATA